MKLALMKIFDKVINRRMAEDHDRNKPVKYLVVN